MNIDKDKQTIKNTIYTENGEKMFYIDLDSREAEKFIQAIENVLSDRETWKKIAEKLADTMAKEHTNTPYEFKKARVSITDWAKREVEK